ncbi:hypothetical protein G7043_28975 [Lentzea sp. NEAU-D13]|uniref:Uncharacterized protein n=1 Tax=Lentzea alba TaxID=2714351 RepID=A0A7C9VZY7_9PSEU|nr:hypothetical protein [Lentzea alba]NGY62961.1 hypothetical protein [Lentzea alba]
MGAGVKRAAMLALLVVASGAPAPAAQAVTLSVTAKCTEGDFSGKFTLRYDRGTEYRLVRGTGAAGPYIADSGVMGVKVYHRVGSTQTAMLERTKSGLKSDEVGEVAVNGTRVPISGRAWLEVKFSDRGGAKCTGVANLR